MRRFRIRALWLPLLLAVSLPAGAADPTTNAEAGPPFPAALRQAAVEQSQITDIHRQALVLGQRRLGRAAVGAQRNALHAAVQERHLGRPRRHVPGSAADEGRRAEQQVVRRRLSAQLEEALPAAALRRGGVHRRSGQGSRRVAADPRRGQSQRVAPARRRGRHGHCRHGRRLGRISLAAGTRSRSARTARSSCGSPERRARSST